jgi:hypothetical protein
MLSDAQVNAINCLNAALSNCAYNSEDLWKAMDTLAETLYMPENTKEMICNDFLSPVMAMVCLRALAAEGGFLSPKLITGKAVAIQYSIRLCIYFIIMKCWRQWQETGGKDPEAGHDWFW